MSVLEFDNVRRSLPSLNGDALKVFTLQARMSLVKIRPKLDEEDKNKNIHLRLFMLMQGVGGYKDLLELAELYVIDGRPDMSQLRQAKIFSYEKALRTAEHFRVDKRVRSAYQCDRDRDRDRYGGAFLVRCIVPQISHTPVWLLPSISGIGEKEDEAIGLRTVSRMPWQADPRDIGDVRRASRSLVAEWLLAA